MPYEDTDTLATETVADPVAERWVQRAALTGLAGLLAACATPGGRLLQRPGQQYSRANTAEEAARFLLQAQFSASDAEIAAQLAEWEAAL